MSILAEKKVAFVGNDVMFSVLKDVLKRHHAVIIDAGYDEASAAWAKKNDISIMVVGHRANSASAVKLLKTFQGSVLERQIPVFAVVKNTDLTINDALMNGAVDYFTDEESEGSVMSKIRLSLGQPDNFSGANIFDVPVDNTVGTKKGVRVYIVEDDPLLRNLLDAKLSLSNFPHEFSLDGADSLSKIKQFKPNVIVLDLMLPVKSGFEILQEIKTNQEISSIPVIVFSNRDSQEDREKVFALGAERFFVKATTDLSALIEAIEELS
ncbi:MAG: hypothetical protein RL538_263 [Candidatus Parcubacteria bacterium]|jgi:DNA-binding response OmpR family regulator